MNQIPNIPGVKVINVGKGEDIGEILASIFGRPEFARKSETGADMVARVRTVVDGGADVETFTKAIAHEVDTATAQGSVRVRCDVALGLLEIGASLEPAEGDRAGLVRGSRLLLILSDAARHLFASCADKMHENVLETAATYMARSQALDEEIETLREAEEGHEEAIAEARREAYDEGHEAGKNEGYERGYEDGQEEND